MLRRNSSRRLEFDAARGMGYIADQLIGRIGKYNGLTWIAEDACARGKLP
jgi:hypothetical protein